MTHVRLNARYVIGSILLWMFLIVVRLIYVQAYQHANFTYLARQQAYMKLFTRAERGYIYDRNGTPLVHNRQRPALCIAPSSCNDITTLRTYIAQHFPDRLPALDKAPHAHFLYLRRHPSDEELRTITDHPISDIFCIYEAERAPAHEAIQPIVGHTDSDNTGISGLEYWWDAYIRGTTGIHHLYRDARSHGIAFKDYVEQEHTPGNDIYTTIDDTLQFLVHNTVAHHVDKHNASAGAAIVMDPSTGDVHAMTHIGKNPHESFMPITQTYECGSVIKALLITAALAENVASPDEHIWCDNTRQTTVRGMPITTWRAHGTLTCADVIRCSNNIGTAKIAQRLGTRLYTYYRDFGLASHTGIDFPGEQAGEITHPKRWSLASPLSLSFGYEVRVSLIQLARAFSLFANYGHLVTPRLTHPNTPGTWSDQKVPPKTIEQVRDVIDIEKTGNTARRGHIPGYRIYGKTGSAYLITNGAYDHTRPIYTFAGLIEDHGYQRVIVTCIREPMGNNLYAATVAVPVFKDIAENVLLHDHQIRGDAYVHTT